jgi:hypothetical protein
MGKLQTLLQWVLLLAALTAAFWAGRLVAAVDALRIPREAIHSPSTPTLEAIQKLSTLMVTRVSVADVSQTRIDGYAGGITAVVVIHGDFLLGVDLSAAKFVTVNEKGHSVVMQLPPPTVSSPRLDQEKTRLLCLNRQGLWSITPGDAGQEAAVNHAYRHAQSVVAAAGSDTKLLEDARGHTETVLTSFFTAIGWNVTIRWSDRL